MAYYLILIILFSVIYKVFYAFYFLSFRLAPLSTDYAVASVLRTVLSQTLRMPHAVPTLQAQ